MEHVRQRLGVVGDLVEDVIVLLAGPVQRGTDNSALVSRVRGGSAANVAAMAAEAETSLLVRFIGCVGDDEAGSSLERDLVNRGVDVRLQRRGRTGTVVVLVDADGERTMFPDRGASALLSEVDTGWAADLDLLHISAYSLADQSTRDVLGGLARLVRSANGSVSIDLSAASLITAIGADRFAEMVVDLAPAIVFANGDEMDALGAAAGSIRASATVVVKHGAHPTIVNQPGERDIVIDVPPVADVIDTTGAGDAFAAGYLVACVMGADAAASCRRGHELAALVLGHAGAGTRPGDPFLVA
ncbi:MAG: carbohydrate kinase family protein [Ilumatobacteraceae bacterium]